MATDRWTQMREALKNMKQGVPANQALPAGQEPFKPFVERAMEFDYGTPLRQAAQATGQYIKATGQYITEDRRPLYPNEMRDISSKLYPTIPDQLRETRSAFRAITPNQLAQTHLPFETAPVLGPEPAVNTPQRQPSLTTPTAKQNTGSRYLEMYYAGKPAQDKFISQLPVEQQPVQTIRGRTPTFGFVPTGAETSTTRTTQTGVPGNLVTTQEVNRRPEYRRKEIAPGGLSVAYADTRTGKEYPTELEAAYGVNRQEEQARAAAAAKNATDLEKARITAGGKAQDKVKQVVQTQTVDANGVPQTQNTILYESGKTKPLEPNQNGLSDILNMIKANQADMAAQAMMSMDRDQAKTVINSLPEDEAMDLIQKMRALSQKYQQRVK